MRFLNSWFPGFLKDPFFLFFVIMIGLFQMAEVLPKLELSGRGKNLSERNQDKSRSSNNMNAIKIAMQQYAAQ